MKLPDLNRYCNEFESTGLKLPLPVTPFSKNGLLSVLPPVSPEKSGWPWTEETSPAIYDSRTNWPKITIVTPSYEQGKFIEETVRAILLQNYPNLEYIIMDGGSNDGTKAILEKYSPWIGYWQSKPDAGQGQAINMGFSLATGEYRAWINSDDYYLKNVFHTVITAALRKRAQFIYGYVHNYYVNEKRFELVKVPPLLDYFIKIPALMQPSTFWVAAIHQPIWEELHCSLDFELWLRMVKGKRKLLIKEALSVANVHEDAKTVDPKMQAKWHEDHLKIWSEDAHGRVGEWRRINFLNRIRLKFYKLFNRI